MRNINFYFPNLDEKYLSNGMYKITHNDLGAYSYFKTEYSRTVPYDPERILMECETKSRAKEFLEKIKNVIKYREKTIIIKPNSRSYSYFKCEYKSDPFLQDFNNNILIPEESLKKVKSRR